MKRALALLVTLLMVFSLFPISALADGESINTPEPVTAEEAATPEPTATPVETPTPEPVVTPEPTATEALASESPSVEALFLRFLDCDSLDADGAGHTDVLCLADETIELKASAETNGELSYRWQVLDSDSTSDDPYVDISTSDMPTADEKALSVLVDAAMLGVEDYFRCVVTATSGEESVVSYSYFTLKSSSDEATLTPELSMLAAGLLDFTIAGSEAHVSSFSGLQSAINSGATTIYVDNDITVSSNYSISSSVSIVSAGGYTITIQSGKTLTNNGLIEVFSGSTLSIDGTLVNTGTVYVWNGSTLNAASGSSYSPSGSNASLIVEDVGTSGGVCVVNNVSNDKISYLCDVDNESDLVAGLSAANNGYNSASVYIDGSFTLAGDATIPDGVLLYVYENFTIASGATLTVNGSLDIPSGKTLTNRGTIENNGDITVEGTLTQDGGTITGSGTYYNPGTATTEAALRAAITAGKTDIDITTAFTLTADLTIPSGVTLNISGVTITVPSGKTMTVNGEVDFYSSGRLQVNSGATLNNNGRIYAIGGTLLVQTGATYTGGELYQYSKTSKNTIGGTITGVAKSKIVVVGIASVEADVRTAAAFGGNGYSQIEIDLIGNISLTSNLVLPSEAYVIVGAGSSAVTLTVPTGKILTNNGQIFVNPGSTLLINTGATLANNGTIEVYGTFDNKGTLSGSGILTTGSEVVSDWDALVAAVQEKRSSIYLDEAVNITLESNLVIPAGSTLYLGDDGSSPTLTIPAGNTLTINGDLTEFKGTFIAESGGALVNNGDIYVQGGSFTVASGASFVNNDYFDLSNTGAVSIDADSYSAAESAQFVYNDSDGATLTGIALSNVYYWVNISDASKLSDALAMAAAGYQTVEIALSVNATVDAGTQIAKGVNFYVNKGATLTIPSGVTATLSGFLNIASGATLKIESGATLIIADGGSLNVSGTLQNAGTITNNGSFSNDITSDAALRSALAAGVTDLNITGGFSLASDFILPANANISITGVTLTVPSGKTLTLNGTLNLANGSLVVNSTGKLINNDRINVIDSSILTVATGATYTQASDAYLEFTYNIGAVNGIAKSLISCDATATTETALRAALALTGYRDLTVDLYSSVVLSANLTVPVNVSLNILGNPSGSASATLAVPSGRTLTCSGYINLLDDGILEIRTGGTLLVTSTGALSFNGGEMIASGTVTYANGSGVSRSIYTEADLISAIAAKTTELLIVGDITLSTNITIPEEMYLALIGGGKLTVPSGITLALGANDHIILNGSLKVESGGTLSLADLGGIVIDNSGSLDVAGSITFGGDNAMIYLNKSGDSSLTGLTGSALDHVSAIIWVSNETELQDALNSFADSSYKDNEVYLSSSITLSGVLSVPSPVVLNISDGKTLTIPSGKKLTIADGASMFVFGGGKLVVNGAFENNGEASLSLNDVSGSGTIKDNSGSISYTTTVTTLAQLKTAIDSGKRPLDIECSGFTFTSNMTIPENVSILFNAASTAGVASGVTLTNNGTLNIAGKFTISGTLINNNDFTVEEGGTLTNNGTFTNKGAAEINGAMVNNGTVTVTAGHRVRFNTGASKSGTKATGTWYSIVGNLATGIEIDGPSYLGIGVDLAQTYEVQMLPTDAWPVEVTWSIVSGGDFATINADTGKLTGIAQGDVTIRATATDGSALYDEMTVHVVSYAVVISGANSVTAGKTLQLAGSFVPSNVTNSTIVWSLAAGDSAYATVSTSGLVTAKAVTEQHIITVIARAADGAADEAQKEITIYPVTTAMQILDDEETNVTGTTIALNSNDTETLTFTYGLTPEDANPNVTWVLSASDAATMVTNSDGSVVISPISGKTKLVTLTAKSNDGSGVSAIVKIQVSALTTGVYITEPSGHAINAGAKTQLTANFTDPKPSNQTVTWYLAPEYDAYATLSTTGLLTAKAVTKEVSVWVQAIPKDGGTVSDLYEVKIKPLASSVSIKQDGVIVTNGTLIINLKGTTTLQLAAQTWPDDAADDVTWKSSAPLVASVDATSGLVTGLKAGTAMITAISKDGSNKTASVKINVTSLSQHIALYQPTTPVPLSLRGGASATYRVYDTDTNLVLPTSAVTWSTDSANAPFATVSTSGALTTYPVSSVKTITLTAKVVGNETAQITQEITIYPATQSLVLYNGSSMATGPIVFDTLGSTSSVTLTAMKLPTNSLEDVVWSTSNTNVAKVTDGVITPVSNGTSYNKGTATITAKTTGGSNVSVSIQVVVAELVQGITLSTATGSAELVSGYGVQIKSALTNTTATNKTINYSIDSGSDYATLSGSGYLTAKQVYQAETVVVKATSADGNAESTITITIEPKYDVPLTIENTDTGEIITGSNISLDATGLTAKTSTLFKLGIPEAETTTKVKWSVAPSYVASVVTSSGVTSLNYLSTGTAVVTATATETDGKVRTASFTIELYKPATSLTITPPTGLDVSSLTLASGKTMLFTGTILPKTGITTSGVVWYLDDTGKTVATISSTGLLTAKAGLTDPVTILVQAKTKNAPYKEATPVSVTILPVVTAVDILSDETVINGQTFKMDLSYPTWDIDAVTYPDDANQNVVWTSSNKTLATVDANGVIKVLKAGTVTITATAADGSGKASSIKLVILTRVMGLEITSTTGFNLRSSATLQLAATFTPTTPTDKRVTWSLSAADAQYATLSAGGLLKANALTHMVSITVTATSVENSDMVATKVITIYPATTKVEMLNTDSEVVNDKTILFDLYTLDSMQFDARNLPSATYGALQGVTWKSSNTSVLTVSADGVVAPVLNTKTGLYNTGTVTITATATDGSGKVASIKIVASYQVSGISFASGLTVQGGKAITLKPIFAPTNATSKTVKWTIKASDAAYATISTTGALTAKKVTAEKTITVYCTAQDGSGVVGMATVTITP